MEYAVLELDTSSKGWRCSECGLFSDALGRPIFGSERWSFKTTSLYWLENKPNYRFCPGCGKPIRRDKNA